LRATPDHNEFLRMIGEKPMEEQAIASDRMTAAGGRR
jgi:hypothetical protein